MDPLWSRIHTQKLQKSLGKRVRMVCRRRLQKWKLENICPNRLPTYPLHQPRQYSGFSHLRQTTYLYPRKRLKRKYPPNIQKHVLLLPPRIHRNLILSNRQFKVHQSQHNCRHPNRHRIQHLSSHIRHHTSHNPQIHRRHQQSIQPNLSNNRIHSNAWKKPPS